MVALWAALGAGAFVAVVLEAYHADEINRLRNKAAYHAKRRCMEGR